MKGDEHVHLHGERDVEGDDGPPLHRGEHHGRHLVKSFTEHLIISNNWR